MQIPTYDSAPIAPNVQAAPQRSGNSPVAQALGSVGGALEKVSNEAFDYTHQEYVKANAAVVQGRVAKLNEGQINLLHDPKTGLLVRQGEKALNITPEGLTAFDKLYDTTAAGLTPEQLRLFKQQTYEARNSVQLQLERHEADQGKVVQQTNSKAVVDTDQQLLSTLYRDPIAFGNKLKETKAHVLDMLHMHGFSDDSPAAKEALANTTSEAWSGAIGNLLAENPAQARHLYEVHQDDLAPHQRLALGERVRATSDKVTALSEATAINSTMGPAALLAADKDGTKYHGNVKLAPFDLQGMMEEVRKKYADNPDVVEHVEANLVKMKMEHTEAAREQRETNTDYVYGLFAAGKSPSEAYASKQYQELSGKDKKSVQDYVKQQRHEADFEARADRTDRRAARAEMRADHQDNFEAFIGGTTPDDIHEMSTATIQHLAGKIGTANVSKLLKLKKDYDANEHKLASDKAEESDLKETMAEAGYDWAFNSSKSADEKRTYGKVLDRVTSAIREEGTTTGKQVSPERKREIYKEQLLKVHTMKSGMFGNMPVIGGPSKVERRLFDTEPYNVVVEGAEQEDVAMAVSVLSSKGIKHPSYDLIRQAVQLLKK